MRAFTSRCPLQRHLVKQLIKSKMRWAMRDLNAATCTRITLKNTMKTEMCTALPN